MIGDGFIVDDPLELVVGDRVGCYSVGLVTIIGARMVVSGQVGCRSNYFCC